MAGVALRLYDELDRALTRIEGVRDSGIAAFERDALRQSDLDHLFESTFLGGVIALERFLEKLFFACLEGTSGIAAVAPRLMVPPHARPEPLVLELERAPFLTWMPYDATHRRAEVFLKGARPFERLLNRPSEKTLLSTVTIVRNVIAHRSGKARAEFRKLTAVRTLPPSRQTAAGYLQLRSGATTQHEVLVSEVRRVASALTASTLKRAQKFLRSERPYETGQQPGRGTFECVSCRTRIRVPLDTGTLAPCAVCSPGPCATCGRLIKKSQFQRVR